MGGSLENKQNRHKPIKAIYGNVVLLKYFCPRCKSYSFVVGDEFQCCGLKKKIISEDCRVKREAEGSLVRKQPPAKIKKRVLTFQNYQCVYCGCSLRGKTPIEWDHFSCFAMSGSNSKHNFVASCKVCNRIKGALIFGTMREAQVYIWNVRQGRGFENHEYYGGIYESDQG